MTAASAAATRARPMATVEQIRAGRALIGWTQGDLAEHAGLSQTGIARIENGTNRPNTTTLEKILRAFDREDVEMVGTSGVKKRTGEIRTLTGRTGFADFRDDVLREARKGNADICISSVDERLFDKWGSGTVNDNYRKEMAEISAANKAPISRSLGRKGDAHFPAKGHVAYRWIPDNQFGEFSFYVYGQKTAILLFTEEEIEIIIINNPRIAAHYRKQFNDMWAKAEIPNS
ncbi:MAG TPA: XRE family transcriptional regulator [Rhodospirillaceae bacterium]|jgi:transcriptional regulator with XRE-family HTH domain|nr:helix-turn-helix transcriptional regulator [Alphaproteobacteria bacterium]HBH25848.1 XRE family transcriptional regulator [Rhodospirillaceae bacterium]